MKAGSDIFFSSESRLAEYSLIFATGGVLYYTTEMLWRGYSHFSMALLGGICFVFLYFLAGAFPSISLTLYCMIGGSIITLAEYLAGELLNNLLGLGVWDYSGVPLNFRGQICPIFSFLWCLLCLPAFFIAGQMRTRIFGYKN